MSFPRHRWRGQCRSSTVLPPSPALALSPQLRTHDHPDPSRGGGAIAGLMMEIVAATELAA